MKLIIVFQLLLLAKYCTLQSQEAAGSTTEKNLDSLEVARPIPKWDPNGYVFFCLCMGKLF